MLWGYLAEFWGKLGAVGDYTIEWFQGIGNAVAGAIGGLFEDLAHNFYDIFYVIQWLLEGLQNLFIIIFRPLTWIFNFGKGFFDTAFKTPEELGITTGEIGIFDPKVFQVFNAIPHANLIFAGVGAGLGILFLVFIIKKLSSI
jgi:hypothetical protein